MLNPNIGKLIMNSPNRYRLVIDVAHTARQIAHEMEENFNRKAGKHCNR